ncbi:ABC transporter ATP-binding protein [Nitrococcus mobilis]|uniref:ABC transporter, ATP-binding protein n=1 Tax=Nitrococcus mobilis Nb-231 TaxID=314278 RepID=A4BL43_9GAMM|nr:ATP-binding cassette domain-containing protein [Nitrococcus mobilis]EAR23031.1 ABC transporter, ATP-binding protein [Nitrococcus mobilis Nb-231]
MADPAIRIRNLVTRLGDRTVHNELNLDIQAGCLTAIAGSSGSGKTVLLRAMALLLQPVAGTIELFGQATTTLSRSAERGLRGRMGVMFQRGALFTGMTVLDNVAFPLREHTALPRSAVYEIARLKLRLAGLAPEAATLYPSELSGGMTKRAALARSLALDPDLLFLDEPTAGLDPVGATAFDKLIVHLRNLLGLTVILVTHDPVSLWEIADEIAFIGAGRVLASGPAQALTQSLEPAVRCYFGGARMQRAGASWDQK